MMDLDRGVYEDMDLDEIEQEEEEDIGKMRISDEATFCKVCEYLFDKESSASMRNEADSILNRFYNQSDAWSICKGVLDEIDKRYKNRGFICMIAAKILKVKFLYYFNEVEEKNYVDWFNFLMSTFSLIQIASR